MERITSRQNPLITRLRRLGAEKKTRRAQGVFLCEGTKLVGEAPVSYTHLTLPTN